MRRRWGGSGKAPWMRNWTEDPLPRFTDAYSQALDEHDARPFETSTSHLCCLKMLHKRNAYFFCPLSCRRPSHLPEHPSSTLCFVNGVSHGPSQSNPPKSHHIKSSRRSLFPAVSSASDHVFVRPVRHRSRSIACV